MASIDRCELPPGALLRKYQHEGAFADCYSTEVSGRVAHAEFVEAFYTTALFKVERWLLAWLAAKPSTDDDVRQLSVGDLDAFAAWRVEARCPDQLLLSDFRGRTRSWLMVEPERCGDGEITRLYFGSAVIPVVSARKQTPTLGFAFRPLLGFHKLYSRALLSAARSRLAKR